MRVGVSGAFAPDYVQVKEKFLFGGVAQLAEQENHNLCVRGSNPFAAISIFL